MTERDDPVVAGDNAYSRRMLGEARRIRRAAEAAFLPAVRSQLMARVIEFENAATGEPDLCLLKIHPQAY